MLLEKKWILKILFYLYKIQTVELVLSRAKNGGRKAPSKNFGMVPTWKTKKGKTSKFVDAGGHNRNKREREELATWNWSTERGGKKNEFTLGTERCESIHNLYINILLLN